MSEATSKIDWQALQSRTKEVLGFLLEYFKNPIIGIRQVPEWDWPTVIIVQGALSSICGLLSGVVAQSISGALLGFLFFPISSIATHFIVSGFFYYTFLFFYQSQVAFRRLYIVTVLANLPFIVLTILSPLLRPITLVGLAVTGLLLLVGFVENFQLPKRSIARFLVILYGLYVLMWVVSTLNLNKKETAFRKMATPESLDILEKELKGD
ncbi:MAG: hypothetical protein KDD43_15815 [Bdellovibrionales bacterium]|nr:hypothetical protein [Bdellovibrionales bacterium]